MIDSIQNNPELSVNYPEPTPIAELPRELRNATFLAHHYPTERHPFVSAPSFGQHTVCGPVEKSLQPLPPRVRRMAQDTDNNLYYGISGHGVVKFDLKSQDVTPIELGLNVPSLSWPGEITYDTKRKRVILGSSGGGGYLYAYSTENQQWSVISKRPGDLDAFVYSATDDFIYGILFEHSEQGKVASLAKVNAEGSVVNRFTLGPPIHPASLNAGPGVCTTQIAIAGKYIAILVSPDGLGRDHLDAASIYFVDPVTQQVWLTSKKPVGTK